jgi:hypothetical protein
MISVVSVMDNIAERKITHPTVTQVQAGIWTYLEVSIGITCGNLPLLRPLFRRFLEVATSNRSGDAQLNSSKINSQYHRSRLMAGSQLRSDRFTRMSVKMGTDAESTAASGSDLELQERRHIDEGITVHTDIEMSIEEVGRDSPA